MRTSTTPSSTLSAWTASASSASDTTAPTTEESSLYTVTVALMSPRGIKSSKSFALLVTKKWDCSFRSPTVNRFRTGSWELNGMHSASKEPSQDKHCTSWGIGVSFGWLLCFLQKFYSKSWNFFNNLLIYI